MTGSGGDVTSGRVGDMMRSRGGGMTTSGAAA